MAIYVPRKSEYNIMTRVNLNNILPIILLFVLIGWNSPAFAQWTQNNNGLYGATVRSSVVSQDGLTIFVGVPNVGVYKSTDNGSSWSPVNTGLTDKSVYALGRSGTSIFAGMNGNTGVFRTTNNGISWQNVGLTSTSISCFTVNGTNIFAGTFDGVYVSSDNGTSWTQTGLTATTVEALTNNGTFVFAGTPGGVFRSSDNGASWTLVNSGMPSSSVKSLKYLGTDLFAGTVNNGIYKSANNGINWSTVNTGLVLTPQLWVYSLAVIGTNIFAGSNNGVFLSTDNGANWTSVNNGLLNPFTTNLLAAGTNIFAGTEGGGVYKSTDNGANWAVANTGINNADVNFLTSSGSTIFAGTQGAGLFQSTDEAASWTTANTGLTSSNVKAFLSAGTNFLLGTPDGVFLSSNSAATWAITELSAIDVTSLALKGTGVFAGSSTGVYRSTNNGVNWSAVSTGLTNTDVKSMVANGTTVFAGTPGGVFKSTNDGTNWTAANAGLTSTDITFLLVKGANIFAITAAGNIFKSGDNGANWTITGFPGGNFPSSLYVSGSDIFVTASNSLWVSSDDGAIWTRPNDTLFPLTSFKSSIATSTNILVGTINNGVLSRPLSEFFAPTISSFTPTSAPGGATVTITGTYLTGATEVNFGGTPATSFNVVSATSITAVVASGASGDVSVTTPGGTASLAGFTFIVPPTISSFAPTSAGAGATVTINGTKFTGASAVSFGGTAAASYTVLDALTISAVVGAGSSGSVSVTAPDGTATRTGFTYVPAPGAPTISSFSPTSGLVGTSVTITGTNFSTIPANNIVKFNGTNATITGTPTATSIVTTVPVGATTGKITVEVGGQTGTSILNFTVTAPTGPTITSFTPSAGLVGTSITITGTNFSTTPANNIVKFNGTLAVVTGTPTATSIVTTVPAGATTGPITVEVATVVGTSATNFTVTTPTTPTITSFTPSSGVTGTVVTITGTNFNTTPANNIVKFNGTIATITGTPTATSIVTSVPAGATTGNITVEVGGEVGTSATIFTVTNPTISSFSPSSGVVGATVTITGTNFSTTPANNIVKFNGTTATITGTPTTTSIVTSVPTGATTGTITVEVAGQTATSATNFTVGSAVPSEPTIQASNLTITQPFASTLNVTWTNGNGSSRIVVAKQGGTVDQAPVDGVTYAASSSFTSGDDLAGGNYVVYNGTGNSVSVTDIQASTSYEFFVFEYNGSTGSEDYNISTATNNPKSNSATSVPDISIPYSSFGSAESNYRIIAVPLNLNNNKVSDVFDELMPYDDTKWRMFHYQNGSNQEMNGNSTISPGKGYWLIVKDSKTFTSGPGTTVLAPFSVPLVQGWNQIGNPYNFNLSWTDVQAANPGLPGLRKWINTMTDGSTLSKLEGGFVNATAAGTLVFPAIDNGGRVRREEELVRNTLDSPNWQVYLNVDQGELKNRIAGVGMHSQAKDDYDVYDGLSMPHFFNSYLDVNHKKEFNGNFFSKDIVNTKENNIWDLSVVTSGIENIVTFTWDNTYFGDNGKELYLLDVSMQRSINMRTTQEYVFNKHVSSFFQVLFGSIDFVKEKTSVHELVLHKVWPIPVENEMSVAFSLPEMGNEQAVSVELVDLMGRKVWSHVSNYQSGFHEVKWQRSKSEAAGIYLVTVKSGSIYKQVKLVLK